MVKTRMAPSPTGEYHIGHIRTLLFNYAYAKRKGGKFVLRIEDTDRSRFVEGAVEKILQVIKDYGFSWDEGPEVEGPNGPYFQSRRLPIYKRYAEELVGKGAAYYCFCSKERLGEVRRKQELEHKIPKYDRHCLNIPPKEARERAQKEPFVIRLRIPDNEILEYDDLVMGKISINSDNLDDQILLKSDGFPTYHLAVVVDDHLMGITHILRGSEWISSTPKHILLYRYFGWEMPKTGHLPVFLDPQGRGKMSKRKGSVSARSFLDGGYLPEALINFLALLGWSPKDGKEIFSLGEFIKKFDISDINKSNPIFDRDKLNYFNGVYIRKLSDEELYRRILSFDPSLKDLNQTKLKKVLSLEKERLKTLSEFKSLSRFFFEDAPIDKDLLVPEGRTKEEILDHLNHVALLFDKVRLWNLKELKSVEGTLREEAKEKSWKVIEIFSPVRVAITGSLASPPLFETIEILGRGETIKRIKSAAFSL